MENEKKYLSVAEFAAAAGVSQQSVYKRLKSTLKPYAIRENKQTKISEEAFKLYNSTVEQPFNPTVENVDKSTASAIVEDNENQPVVKPSIKPVEKVENGVNELLLETLLKQLEEKDSQIKALTDNLANEQNNVKELNQTINELNNKYALLVSQQQQLSLVDKTTMQPTEPEKENVVVVDATVEPAEKNKAAGVAADLEPAGDPEIAEHIEPAIEKRNFIGRLRYLFRGE